MHETLHNNKVNVYRLCKNKNQCSNIEQELNNNFIELLFFQNYNEVINLRRILHKLFQYRNGTSVQSDMVVYFLHFINSLLWTLSVDRLYPSSLCHPQISLTCQLRRTANHVPINTCCILFFFLCFNNFTSSRKLNASITYKIKAREHFTFP